MNLNILKLSPFQRVIYSLVGGIVFGVLIGEPAGKLEIIGDAYIRLLQMTVLPYILFSLIGGLGQLDMAMAKRIGIVGAGLILFLWATTMLTLLAMPFAYPDWASASFFSSGLITQPASFDALELYIPANPFKVLANTTVPAVVVFSIAMGLSLIAVPNKDTLLQVLQNVSDALMKMASFVAKLAPIGIFALSAAAAGTLDLHSLARLQVYLWVYASAWLVLTFITLPLFVAWATPFSYREVMRTAVPAMVTAFAAGTVLVVLPMIVERCKILLRRHRIKSKNSEAATTIDVLVPTAYSFPSVGTLMGTGFILFAGWFVGSPLDIEQYPGFVVTGAVSAFGTMAVALPFMLDYFHLPSDLFQLYLLGSVMTARFATVLAAMHAVVISLLGVSAMLGLLRKNGLLRVLGISVVAMGLLMWGLGTALTRFIPYEYAGYKSFVSMTALETVDVERIIKQPEKLDDSLIASPRLDVIEQRGTLRVGFPADSLPFAFFNDQSNAVGFDIDLMRILAQGLGVGLELVKLDEQQAGAALNEGRIDVFAGALIATTKRARKWTLSNPYFYQHIGFLVPDYRRSGFSSLEKINNQGPLRIGVLSVLEKPLYGPLIKRYFENIEVVSLDSPRDYLTGKVDIDAMVFPAESGSAWTLIYPEYSMVVPQGMSEKVALTLVIPHNQPDFRNYLNLFIEVMETKGELDILKDYWVYGRTGKEEKE
ncbi:MAG: cation:dicarboxylate symporter family transporter [Thiohalobacterales bacterium]